MGKISKKRKEALSKYDKENLYSLMEACEVVKKITNTKFDSSVDVDVKLGVDPRQANQMVRGTTSLPHGIGKEVRVLALVTPDKEQEAKDAGADHVGLDDYITKIEGGWLDIDVIITMPAVMGKIGRLGRVLGPRNLMPNPKVGTVTIDIAAAVKAAKGGEVQFKVEKAGVIHAGIGKASFDAAQLIENVRAFVGAVAKSKPSGSKGTYMKKISLSSTMGAGVTINVDSAIND